LARARRRNVDWPLAALLVAPSATAMASAVEERFFLPMAVAVYGLVAFDARPTAAWRSLTRRGRALLVVGGAVFVAGCFALSADTYDHLLDPESVGYAALR
jgi:hypothetical protein